MFQDKIQIRKIELDEVNVLQKLSIQTFIESYAFYNTEENMSLFLEENFNLKQLEEELKDSNTAYYFALLDDVPVAYLKLGLGKKQNALETENSLEIERIYVLNAFKRLKIGKQFLEKSFELAKETQASHVWLGVWEHNHNAIQFYEKNGFVAFGTHIFYLGKDEQLDYLMKMEVL